MKIIYIIDAFLVFVRFVRIPVKRDKIICAAKFSEIVRHLWNYIHYRRFSCFVTIFTHFLRKVKKIICAGTIFWISKALMKIIYIIDAFLVLFTFCAHCCEKWKKLYAGPIFWNSKALMKIIYIDAFLVLLRFSRIFDKSENIYMRAQFSEIVRHLL